LSVGCQKSTIEIHSLQNNTALMNIISFHNIAGVLSDFCLEDS
jgi:hypothetical protein